MAVFRWFRLVGCSLPAQALTEAGVCFIEAKPSKKTACAGVGEIHEIAVVMSVLGQGAQKLLQPRDGGRHDKINLLFPEGLNRADG